MSLCGSAIGSGHARLQVLERPCSNNKSTCSANANSTPSSCLAASTASTSQNQNHDTPPVSNTNLTHSNPKNCSQSSSSTCNSTNNQNNNPPIEIQPSSKYKAKHPFPCQPPLSNIANLNINPKHSSQLSLQQIKTIIYT